jgi:serine/threonine-protein kinase HipA
MGALEYKPALGPRFTASEKLDLEELVSLASDVLTHRRNLKASFADDEKQQALRDILRVGTSAGGARAKAIIALNPVTQEVRSGQVTAEDGFEYWLLKFDGVSGNRDKDIEDPRGYCAVEYAYYLMARAAGITMAECRLLAEGPRRHFMARRFDRLANGEKLHMQSLAALMHLDFNAAGAHSYEQAMLAIRSLGLGPDTVEEQFRRAVFNVMARNQDDHVKNIAFLMNKKGEWRLAPAFDLTFAYNPQGQWTSHHQMTLNGKRGDFTLEDFAAFAASSGLKRGRHKAIIAEVAEALSHWKHFADQAEVTPQMRDAIAEEHRTLP